MLLINIIQFHSAPPWSCLKSLKGGFSQPIVLMGNLKGIYKSEIKDRVTNCFSILTSRNFQVRFTRVNESPSMDRVCKCKKFSEVQLFKGQYQPIV